MVVSNPRHSEHSQRLYTQTKPFALHSSTLKAVLQCVPLYRFYIYSSFVIYSCCLTIYVFLHSWYGAPTILLYFYSHNKGLYYSILFSTTPLLQLSQRPPLRHSHKELYTLLWSLAVFNSRWLVCKHLPTTYSVVVEMWHKLETVSLHLQNNRCANHVLDYSLSPGE